MIEEKKDKTISELNKNFRTILSYGNDGLVPLGEFVVIDIREDEIPTDSNTESADSKCRTIVLGKVDDDSVQIVLPMEVFLTQYAELATHNADKLDMGSNVSKGIEDVMRTAERTVLFDGSLGNLVEAETMTLNESGADYLIDGEVQSSNYSICPIDIGLYRERIREMQKIDDDSITMSELIKKQEEGRKRAPYPDYDEHDYR